MKKLLLLLSLTACGDSFAAPDAPPAAPKSVILLIGDGTGPQEFGLLMDWSDAASRTTNFETLCDEGSTGWLRTAPAGGPLTDSAAGATALACGVSTKNAMIAMSPSGKPLPTCLEDARAHGRRTGLVTTATITDATPACFAAHVANRGEQNDIAAQYVHDEHGVDVLFGGGAKHFSAKLLEEAAAKGWKTATSPEDLAALSAATPKALGLFAKGNVPFALDRDQEGEAKCPSLPDMTKKALEILGRDDTGFFLMVEGGRIDHACHGNDAPAALGELREFDAAIGLCDEYRRKHPDTLVIVTADHETGGMAVTSGNEPATALTPESFLAMAKVEKSIEGMNLSGRPPKDFDPATKFGAARVPFYPAGAWVSEAAALERSAQFCVSFGSYNHTTTPVMIAAAGPGAAAFVGCHRNTLVGQKLREWMSR
jgi:alkaline phosphatase